MNIVLISLGPNISAFGLRTISACLKKAGHNTKLILMPEKINEKYEQKTLNEMVGLASNSDLICLSLTTNFFDHAVQITKRLKKEFETPVIWGGIHPTIRPEECLQYADIVCRGEGEEAIVEVAEKIKNKKNYYDIKNIGIKDKKGKIILNSLRPLIEDLDSIPFPDYDFKNQYIILGGEIYKMDEADETFLKKIWDQYETTGTFYITQINRGCRFGCTYCCNNILNKQYAGQKICRKRSVDNVIEELKIAKNKFHFLENIMVSDNNFLELPIEYIKEFSEKYKKYIKLPIISLGVHPTTVDREKFYYFIEAGLSILSIGVQTASERIKKLYKRNYPNSQVERAVKIINEFKDKIKYIMLDIIIDNPWETEKDSIETLMFLTKLPLPYGLNLFSLILFPETDLYNLGIQNGFINKDDRTSYQKSFYQYKKNYINNLFYLLKKYVAGNRKIPPTIMALLTNKILRKLQLSGLLYLILDNYIEGRWIAKVVASRRKIKNFVFKNLSFQRS